MHLRHPYSEQFEGMHGQSSGLYNKIEVDDDKVEAAADAGDNADIGGVDTDAFRDDAGDTDDND